MSLIIQMYRTSQYDSWEQAEDEGGMYSVFSHYADPSDITPKYDTGALDDILDAVIATADMYDGGYSFKVRLLNPDTKQVLADREYNSRGAVPTTSFEPSRGDIGNPT